METELYRILTGYIIYNPGIKLKIMSPNPEVRYESCLIYDKVLKKECGITNEEMFDFMIKQNIWTEDDDHTFNLLPKNIEELKLNMFKNIHSPSSQKRFQAYLNVSKEAYNKLQVKRHSYDYITREGVAHFAKWQYIIAKSTFFKGKRWNWSKGNTYDALNIYYQSIISDDTIRKIVRSSHWDMIKDCLKPSMRLTQDQQRLLAWSSMYEAAYEQIDYPPKLLIENDDVFDGWVIYMGRKRNQLNPDKVIQNEKIANSREVFLPGRTKEDFLVGDSMNSERSKQIIKDRFTKLKQEGQVEYHKFKDVQMRKFEK